MNQFNPQSRSMNLTTSGKENIGKLFYAPEETKHIQKFSPEYQQLLDQITQMAMGELQGDSAAGFAPYAEKARHDYKTKTIPYLSERFASMGQGAGRSGGFRAALEGSGEELEKSLAAMGSQYGLQQRGLSQQLLGMGLGQRTDTLHTPAHAGPIMQYLPQLLGML